jgi:L-ascorbate metabolism protein UlaG (beta-lactamase superfamily)
MNQDRSLPSSRPSRCRRWGFGILVISAAFTLAACASAGMETYKSLLRQPQAEGTAGADTLTVTWLGTAGVYLEDGETGILVDPFVTRPGILKVALGMRLAPDGQAIDEWIRRAGIRNVKGVLVSHSHYDHSMDAPEFAKRLGAPLFGSESTANIGRGAGLPEDQIRVVETGAPVQVGNFEVTFIESRHGPALFGRVPYPGVIREPLVPPAPARAYRLGETYSILIAHPCGTLLHHGSAGFKEGETAGVKAEVVLLGIAGREDTEAYLRSVVDPVGARRVVPIHLDNFFVPLTRPIRPLYRVKPAEFFRTAATHQPALKVETLPLGTPVPLFP